jgi:hypothetical protein
MSEDLKSNSLINEIFTDFFNNFISYSQTNDFINTILNSLDDKIRVYLYIIYSMLLLSILLNTTLLILFIIKKN